MSIFYVNIFSLCYNPTITQLANHVKKNTYSKVNISKMYLHFTGALPLNVSILLLNFILKLECLVSSSPFNKAFLSSRIIFILSFLVESNGLVLRFLSLFLTNLLLSTSVVDELNPLSSVLLYSTSSFMQNFLPNKGVEVQLLEVM